MQRISGTKKIVNNIRVAHNWDFVNCILNHTPVHNYTVLKRTSGLARMNDSYTSINISCTRTNIDTV